MSRSLESRSVEEETMAGNVNMRAGMVRLGAMALIAGSLASAGQARAQAQDVIGTWLSESKETRVRVAPCGAALCGTIVWVKGDARDENNPNAALRTRSLVGVQMMTDIRPSGAPGEYAGSLYNYKDGKTYSGRMKVKGGNALELSGCVLGGLICRGQTWSRVN
ncbi:DUF2147 domain-containing protein [Chelatococcus sp. SYSU_G07232]|uniref:DUF2147 domain-containing protein n=1 Tax=Chelatococcus albus TaxID=3047466 RepID=A0ABT7ACV4_9HYPH|nr:DUF2147 domain-containing protein [Chelatococcus sp. SYSU_G07232]MDJ1157163.1 DUF2147 domain-containing protein [Chelatococcus sp. SYSU_G07232]